MSVVQGEDAGSHDAPFSASLFRPPPVTLRTSGEKEARYFSHTRVFICRKTGALYSLPPNTSSLHGTPDDGRWSLGSPSINRLDSVVSQIVKGTKKCSEIGEDLLNLCRYYSGERGNVLITARIPNIKALA